MRDVGSVYLGADHLTIQTELVFTLPRSNKDWTIFCPISNAELLIKRQPHEWLRGSAQGLPSFFEVLSGGFPLTTRDDCFEWKSICVKVTSKEIPSILFQTQRSLKNPSLTTLEPMLLEIFKALLLTPSWEKGGS